MYQHGAKNHEQLKSKLSNMPDCQPFKIKTFKFSLNLLCSSHLAAGTLSGPFLPFTLERSKEPIATTGLVLKGQEIGGDPASQFGEEYYGVSTAHAILKQREVEELYFADTTSDEYKRVLNRVEGDFRENTWTLRAAGNDGGIRITETPIFSYGVKRIGLEWFRMFFQDIVIFKLDKDEFKRKGWIDEHPVTGMKRIQAHTSFSHAHGPAHSKITGILKVMNRFHIAMLEKARVHIVVDNTTGFIVESPRTTQCYGLHICFMANSRLVKRYDMPSSNHVIFGRFLRLGHCLSKECFFSIEFVVLSFVAWFPGF